MKLWVPSASQKLLMSPRGTEGHTVHIGFCNLRHRDPKEVAKSSGFPLGIATRWSLEAIFPEVLLSFQFFLGIPTSTVVISLYIWAVI